MTVTPTKPSRAAEWWRVQRRRVLWGVAIAVVALVVAVVVARLLRGLPAVEAFVAEYPGVVPPPEGTPVGIPAWLGWQHFLNAFFLALLVKTGLELRSKRRPPGFWTRDNTRWPRTTRAPRRLGIWLWFHLWLDAFWVLTGVSYVVLLFATGQWLRIVPTDWAVVPNAISAALQYASLDWPTEDSWVVYNSLQQLAYFTVVFIAAPLALLTGLRLSSAWPVEGRLASPSSERLARAIHYPVMLFFLAFTFVHVVLVFTTGALRKLNQMYTARDADDWLGFAVFALSVAVMAAAWVLARPPLLKRIAAKSGRVQG
ncbi:cytochrome b/b6 domain-containing protein [Agromyces aurantiacus]|uniref:Cytochrome b/b6 domain-containing protein n=1 Tax=Agromyces aurantiacus TaxID=165814 RepID=A0ABV9R6R6_9MICO|nr:cytochrome b/b6 domain-containing protein [Agromyces aurantiacus]MBM7503845.1 thiosulfate reductase cytochrome b subunit [Agromyces aurantiacus]